MNVNVDCMIGKLFDYAVKSGLCCEEDRTYMINSLLMLLKRPDYTPCDDGREYTLEEILQNLCDYGVGAGLIESDSVVLRDIFDTALMGVFMPRPSDVNREFYTRLAKSPESATDWFYNLQINGDYIRKYRICKDLKWEYPGKFGNIDITVNLSKPEKDPRMIAAARNLPKSGYPACALCRENEGYYGDLNHAARRTIRLIPITLAGEQWFLQYSPYSYYNEHCIALSAEHRPMKIDRKTFVRMMDFVTLLPHYFIGSNADLPIVGGSILSHDHMQGGRYEFAMTRAGFEKKLSFVGFENIEAGLLDWPLTAIRLRSGDRDGIVELADKILCKWREYSDTEAGIIAETDGIPHNTVTPIARRSGDGLYELDLVLRCNITSDEHPLGVFHPHAEKHHIKKENIGLIEVMGLAVLPSRLKSEIDMMNNLMIQGGDARSNPDLEKHADWLDMLRQKYADAKGGFGIILENEIGKVFEEVLEDAGVYKCDAKGRAMFARFVDIVNS